MKCVKCEQEIPDGSVYCNYCGKKQITQERKRQRRANGEGSLIPLPNGKVKAVKTLSYVIGEDGGRTRKTLSRTFIKRSDGILWLKAEASKKSNTIARCYWLLLLRDTTRCGFSCFTHLFKIRCFRIISV